jgi:hypothetical protein
VAIRAHVLGQLQRELRAARDVREDAYAAQIEQEIARLSQGSAGDPQRETAARKPAREVTRGTVRPRRPRAHG